MRRPTARIPRPDSVAEERGGPTAWLTPWPDSVANIVRPGSVANISNIMRPESVANIGSIVRPDSVANIGNIMRPDSVANIGNIARPDSVANIRGPAAWLTCDPFRRWPSVSTRGKAPVLKSRTHRNH